MTGRAKRREFPLASQLAIIKRAMNADGKICCELCGAWLKSSKEWEIDHIIAEGIRPAADKRRSLKAIEGRLLCKAVCHRVKTAQDVGDISQAKRRAAKALGLKPPGKVEIKRPEKLEKKPLRTAPGPVGMARRFR